VLGLLAAPAPAAAQAPPEVTGPLFFPSVLGLGPPLELPHYCTASVLHSPGRDLIITAAHCVLDGTGAAVEFAPGYHDGVSPRGVWAVRQVYVDHAWREDQDPQDDVAILRVAAHGDTEIEDVTGGSTLGGAPAPGTALTVTGYVAGTGGRALRCTARSYDTDGFPTVDCPGYADGVSGGPWLRGRRLVGVIGGLHQGGCTADTSYTAAFGAAVQHLLARAERGGPGDNAPLPGSDGC
jgi:V8-like Glu-specific endopeptidase